MIQLESYLCSKFSSTKPLNQLCFGHLNNYHHFYKRADYRLSPDHSICSSLVTLAELKLPEILW